jgi:alpha-1,2-mannosyltransferase
VVLACVVVAASLWLRWSPRAPFLDVDVEVYARAGRSLLDHRTLYAATGELPFTYPPFAAILFVPLGLAGDAAPTVMFGAGLLAYVIALAVVGRSAGLSMPLIVLLGLGGLALEPVFRTFSLGQVNLVLMAFVVIDLLAGGRRWSGIGVGIAAAVKLTPAFFVLWFVIRRDVPALARSAAVFVVAGGLGFLVAPGDSARFWSGRESALATVGDEQLTGANQSVRAVVVRLLADRAPSWWLVGPLVLAAAALSVVAARRTRACPALSVGCLALGALLVSPVSWTHHWVWFAPLAAGLVAVRRAAVAWLVCAVAFVAPMWLSGRSGKTALGAPPGDQLLDASYVVLAVGLLLWLAVRSPKLSGSGKPPAQG